MTERNLTVRDAIIRVFKKHPQLEYNSLLKEVTTLYETENKFINKEGKEELLIFNIADKAEFNQRLRDFIDTKQIGCKISVSLSFSEYTISKGNISKDNISCLLFWIDNSVHNVVVTKITKVIKDDFSRNKISVVKSENTIDYHFSEIEVINNNKNTYYVDFYEFKNKKNALYKYTDESNFDIGVVYDSWDRDYLNKTYNLNLKVDIKAYMFYPEDSKHNWGESHLFESIKVFVCVNNYYIVFKINEDGLEYIIRLADKIISAIYKEEL